MADSSNQTLGRREGDAGPGMAKESRGAAAALQNTNIGTSGGVEQGNRKDSTDHDASAPARVMAENHAVLRAKLEETLRELEIKKKILREVEEEGRRKEAILCIAEQNLRTLNEKVFYAKESLKEKEERHADALKELSEIQWAKQKAGERISKVETQYVDFQVEKVIRQDEVTRMELPFLNAEQNQELEGMKKDIERYQSYKDGMAQGDFELKKILSGEKFTEIEKRKDGIRDAFAERDARAEMVYLEIDEKNEAIDELKQSLQIKEKQNQARLRKLKKELQDKEETENHLKQTVEYLEKQIDPALKNSNSIRNSFNSRS